MLKKTELKAHLKREVKKMPVILGKLAGGVTAVAAFTGLFIVLTKTAEPTFAHTGPYLAAGILGILLFSLAPVVFKNRRPAADSVAAEPEKWKVSLIAWLLLLAVCVLLILVSYVMTVSG